MHFVRNGQTEGRTMLKYIGKRVLQLIPVLIGITFLSFALLSWGRLGCRHSLLQDSSCSWILSGRLFRL